MVTLEALAPWRTSTFLIRCPRCNVRLHRTLTDSSSSDGSARMSATSAGVHAEASALDVVEMASGTSTVAAEQAVATMGPRRRAARSLRIFFTKAAFHEPRGNVGGRDVRGHLPMSR